MTDTPSSHHDRRLARRLEDPEFRAEYERASRAIEEQSHWRSHAHMALQSIEAVHEPGYRPTEDEIIDTVLQVVCKALDSAYHPQNPTVAHPTDAVTKLFELDGHEGIVLRSQPLSPWANFQPSDNYGRVPGDEGYGSPEPPRESES